MDERLKAGALSEDGRFLKQRSNTQRKLSTDSLFLEKLAKDENHLSVDETADTLSIFKA